MSQGGARPPDYIYEMAISRVEDLMVQSMPWKRIVAILSAEGFTESEHTAKNWRKEVMRRWAAEESELRPARKDQWRARLEHLYNRLLEQAEAAPMGFAKTQLYAEAIRVAKVAIVMDGVASPIVHKHEGSLDVASMSPMERDAEIAKLLAKREAAQRAAKTLSGDN